ncbi:hypothetical protein L218DRAFT_874688 [Marasmius fiardii PR-910]|nr:hypothetical protein L218DRAFT_874688 [Marasmius fiardii PR-910]
MPLSGAHQVQINNAAFNSVGRDQNNNVYNNTYHIREALAGIGFSYRHDSHARFPYPKCSGDTHKRIVDELLIWARSSQQLPGAYWIWDSANAGKSGITQTVAEICDGKELLAAFFFSREDPNRNNARYLALAIAHEITAAIPDLRNKIMQAVRDKPEILHAALESQFQKLVIEPLLEWKNQTRHSLSQASRGILVIIDGFDECGGIQEQERVLSLLLLAMKKVPLRFLICSRPDPWIRERIDQEDQHIQYSLEIQQKANRLCDNPSSNCMLLCYSIPE